MRGESFVWFWMVFGIFKCCSCEGCSMTVGFEFVGALFDSERSVSLSYTPCGFVLLPALPGLEMMVVWLLLAEAESVSSAEAFPWAVGAGLVALLFWLWVGLEVEEVE